MRPTVTAAALLVTACVSLLAVPRPDQADTRAPDECTLAPPDPRDVHVRQRGGDENDCAQAATATILRSFGLLSCDDPGAQLDRLRGLTHEPKERGTSLLGARLALRAFGVRAVAFSDMGAREARGMLRCGAALFRVEPGPGALGHATAFVPGSLFTPAAGEIVLHFDPSEPRPRAYRLRDTFWRGRYDGLVVPDPALDAGRCLEDVCRANAGPGAACEAYVADAAP